MSNKKNNWFLARPQKKRDDEFVPMEEEEKTTEEPVEEAVKAEPEPVEEVKPAETNIFNRLKPTEIFKEPKEVGLSTIHDDVVIIGNIKAASNIDFYGSVTGNIECGDLTIKGSGKVEGDITAKNLTVTSKDIKGNVTCAADMVIKQEAEIVGDIVANNIVCEGKITGNVNAAMFLDLRAGAVVNGDCTFGTIAIEKGGIINGNIKANKK